MSAEVAIQKFSFPFSSAARCTSQQDELTQKGCVQVKALELPDLQEKPVLSKPSPGPVTGARVQKENQAHVGPAAPAPGVAMAAAQVLVCAEASLTLSASPSRQPTFEKLMVESEDQRPAAKRQLSSESAARTITVVKKSAVRKEAEEQNRRLKPKTHLGQKVAPCAAGTGKRKRRKELFTNSEVFHRVDDHVIRTGAEVRPFLISLLLTATDTNLPV